MEDKLRPIINVAGDYVEKKEVQYEIGNVEAGGIGIQIINGEKTIDTSQPAPQPTSTVQYSRFLKRGANPLKSDDEVQQNFVNAALSGPSALVDYLLSAEGKLHFDISDIKPSFLINTINQECGTKIKLKSYQTAMQRKM
jgi:hypothetical protein